MIGSVVMDGDGETRRKLSHIVLESKNLYKLIAHEDTYDLPYHSYKQLFHVCM